MGVGVVRVGPEDLPVEPFGSEEALRVGLVQRVVPTDGLDEAVDTWLAQLRAGAPGAVSGTKRYINQIAWGGLTPEVTRALAIETIADRRMSEEGQEGQ